MLSNGLTESRLFHLARQGARLPHWLAILPLAVAFIFASHIVAGVTFFMISAAFSGLTGESSLLNLQDLSPMASTFSMLLSLILPFAGVVLLIWLWLKIYEKRPFSTLGFEKNNALKQYGQGILVGAALFSGAIGLMALFGFVQPQAGDSAQTGLPALGGVLLVFLGWMAQGAGEEILTRGWLMPVFGARTRPWIGILVGALLFSVLHGLNPNLSVLAFVNLALFGLFATFYALREGSLWGVCAVHSVWNWFQGNIFGLEVSGLNVSGGTLFKFVATGPDWFTGGAFGPEGGLAVSLMLLLGILAVFAWPRSMSEQTALPTSSPLS